MTIDNKINNVLTVSLDTWGDLITRRILSLAWEENFDSRGKLVTIDSDKFREMFKGQLNNGSGPQYFYPNLLDELSSLTEFDTLPLKVNIFLDLLNARDKEVYTHLLHLCYTLKLMEVMGTLSDVNAKLFLLVYSNIEIHLREDEGKKTDGNGTSGPGELLKLIVNWEYEYLENGGVDFKKIFDIISIEPSEKLVMGKKTRGKMFDHVYIMTSPTEMALYTREESDHVAQKIFQETMFPQLQSGGYYENLKDLPVDYVHFIKEKHKNSKGEKGLKEHGVFDVKKKIPMFSTFAVASMQKPLNYLLQFFRFKSLVAFYDKFILSDNELQADLNREFDDLCKDFLSTLTDQSGKTVLNPQGESKKIIDYFYEKNLEKNSIKIGTSMETAEKGCCD